MKIDTFRRQKQKGGHWYMILLSYLHNRVQSFT